MKHHLLTILLCTFALFCNAQKIEYTIRHIDGGHLFFILPIQIPATTPHTPPLKVDFTLFTNATHTDIRLTALIPDQITIDSIAITTDSTRTSFPANILYIERHKKHWKYRIHTSVPTALIEKIYTAQQPYRLHIIPRPPHNTTIYSPSTPKWKKHSRKFTETLQIVKINT